MISALFKHSYQSRSRVAAILYCVSLSATIFSGRGYDRYIAVYDRLFVLKRGIKLARLFFSTLHIDLT